MTLPMDCFASFITARRWDWRQRIEKMLLRVHNVSPRKRRDIRAVLALLADLLAVIERHEKQYIAERFGAPEAEHVEEVAA